MGLARMGGRKHVIVFHCEFSVKRAPTFAKHFRSKDRSLNGHVYPKIHYPEVYVLEGGYSGYYNAFPAHCEPSAYVRMDDPAHQRARASELNDFRRWNRTRSYTYGEFQRISASNKDSSSGTSSQAPSHSRPMSTDTAMGMLSQQQKNGTGAANGGIPRRPPLSTLHTLAEDGDSSCASAFSSEADPIGDSPCPPAGGKMMLSMMQFGSTRGGSGSGGAHAGRGMQRALTSAFVGGGR